MKLALSSLLLIQIGLSPALAGAEMSTPVQSEFYREMTLKVRPSGTFKVPMPSGGDLSFNYEFQFGAPKFTQPIVSDFYLNAETDKYVRDFWDKIFLQDGSYLLLDGQKVPLTCIFVRGQDNRFSQKDSPLIPDFVLKVYLVANDFTCTGPVNPGWPSSGGKKDTWDTFFYFEIRDPTIMLPTEARVRYRWNEFPAILSNQAIVDGTQP